MAGRAGGQVQVFDRGGRVGGLPLGHGMGRQGAGGGVGGEDAGVDVEQFHGMSFEQVNRTARR